jgi:CheY-like chemotaxis protein
MESMPLTVNAAGDAPVEHHGYRRGRGHNTAVDPCRPVVLIVDDDETIAELLMDLLDSEGYRVIVARDGPTALAAARRERPDMILSDCMMPGLSGTQLVNELRRHAATRDIRVALMSSTRPRGFNQPDVPFLAKPFEIDDLLDLVARCTRAAVYAGPLYGEG